MKAIVVGVDIAKRVFQLHWVEPETGEIVALQLKRGKFLEHFANRSKCLIGMEACGGSQHWARSLLKPWSRGEIAVRAYRQAVCGRQQERCGGCTRDLDGGTATGDQGGGGQER